MAVLQGTKRVMKSSGQNNATALGMKLTAKSYDLLISGLYQDVRRAFVRETATNCNDAHIYRDQQWQLRTASTSAMATPVMSVYANKARHDVSNNPTLIERVSYLAQPGTPFEVHLPTSMFPHASFRDYGIGLSLNSMLGEQTWDDDGEYVGRVGGLYTTLFESTKDDSNDFTGALGLGSKTPYAVSTAFTIRSIHMGKYHDYIAYKNEDGLPYCRCTSELFDEDNVSLNEDGCEFPDDADVPKDGLYIEVPLPEEDWGRYSNLAQEIFQVFDPMPIVRGGDYRPDPIKRDEQICNTYLQAGNRWSDNTHYAIMGNVAYPINTSYLSGEASEILNSIPNCTYTVFPIGALNFQPSRDGLNYDDRTVCALDGYFSGIRASIVDRLSARIFRAAQISRHAMYDEIESIKEEVGEDFLNSMKLKVGSELISKKFKFAVHWPHTMVKDTRSVRREDEYGTFHTIKEEYDRMEHMFLRPTIMVMTNNRNVIRESSEQTHYMPYSTIRDAREIVFYQNDRPKQWRRALDIELSAISSASTRSPVVYRVSNDIDFAEFEQTVVAEMGLVAEACSFIKLSEVEIPKTSRLGVGGGPRNETPNVMLADSVGRCASFGDWTKMMKDEWDDIEEGALYIDVKGWSAVFPDELSDSALYEMSLDDRNAYHKRMRSYSVALEWARRVRGVTLYGIRRSGRKAIKEYGLKPVDFDAILADIRKENDEFPEDVIKAEMYNAAIDRYLTRVNDYIDNTRDVVNVNRNTPDRMVTRALSAAQSFLAANRNRERIIEVLGKTPRCIELREYFSKAINVEAREVTIREITVNLDGESFATKSYHSKASDQTSMDMVKPAAFVSTMEPTGRDSANALRLLARNHYAPMAYLPDFRVNELQNVDWESRVVGPCSKYSLSVNENSNTRAFYGYQLAIKQFHESMNEKEMQHYEYARIARAGYYGVNYVSGHTINNVLTAPVGTSYQTRCHSWFNNRFVNDKRVDELSENKGYFPSQSDISDYVS